MAFRITYSVLDADMSEVHRAFDGALAAVQARFGEECPSWVNDRPVRSDSFLESYNPADTGSLLARAHAYDVANLDIAFAHARRARGEWSAMPWQDKVACVRRAADNISACSMEFSAINALEVGKNRLEAMGDVEEAADLLRYYAGQLEEAEGFVKPLMKLSDNEDTASVLRPYGVFVVIAPFNFPVALPAGMSAGALLGGNAVILKPSEDAPWCAEMLARCMHDAGFPSGLFQVLHGRGETLGEALVDHPGVDGVAFTGSSEVGHAIFRKMTERYVRPCFLEMGGKNAAIVCDDAEIETAINGCFKSAFGLSGQKCSALSRIYVHESRKGELIRGLVAKAEAMTIGDPTQEGVYMGPVINASAVDRYERVVSSARADGTVHTGGRRLDGGVFGTGYFVAPTVVEVPKGHRIEWDELFLPLVGVWTFIDLDDAIDRANAAEYGLTGGVYSADPAKVQRFLDRVEAGCVYTNRAAGATTGAWPGVQAFCGWKASGSSGKGGCGPYYVSQFMREQSRTIVRAEP